jgi:serine protease
MKHFFSILAVFLLVNTAFAQKPQFVPGDVIVQVRDGKSIEEVVLANQELNGVATNLRLNRILSPQMRAYLLQFNTSINHHALQQHLFSHPAVSAVQFNHYIQNRALPNDPQLDQQWQHVNANSSAAWDITTGGLTALGDTIVVCIVDDGTSFNHPDLLANQWKNYLEIPDNNIDDDGNGYVDDFDGWDPTSDDDNVGNGGHGINVAGMVGATGNNGVGVVGVNWNVKLMTVTYGNINDEANVIEAYTYPLTMRQLYQQSGGAQGAFVVATNSSWGINNGDPADAPLWCAFYDTLGTYGILSAGATANAQINVDVDGDLPTACSSEYLLSVTATNSDDVRTFSGYGVTTIDLGAPGEDVYTTSGANGYTSTSGTSFASPMVAGAIALMYSAPCASLAAIALADPALAAQYVKQYIMDGVDVVNDLVGYTVTGGRLNLRGALDQLILNCTGAGCIGALNIQSSNITDTQASISWSSVPDVLGFDLRYGLIGGDTLIAANISSPFVLDELTACTDYWFSIRSQCAEDSSLWSAGQFITTDGCCEPPSTITIATIESSSAQVSWSSVLAAESYLVEWREQGTNTWFAQDDVLTADYTISGLTACTIYEVRVSTNCAGITTESISANAFRTIGCGNCTDLTFCASVGSADFEWISNVTINDFTHDSEGNEGYADNTSLSAIELRQGETYDVSFTPGFSNTAYEEHFRVWIDFDGNGVFNTPYERLFDDAQGSNTTVTGTITIPLDADLGSSRLRVSMAYGSDFGGGYPQGPCDNGQDGEIEDFCVNIIEPNGVDSRNTDLTSLELFPNPASDVLQITLLNANQPANRIAIVDMQGRVVYTKMLDLVSNHKLDISTLSAGVYMVELGNSQGESVRARFVKK